MRSRSILDLVEFVVFEVRSDGQVSARNTGAVKLLDALLNPEPRLQALFNKGTVPEVAQHLAAGEELYAELALKDGKVVSVKWQIIPVMTPEGEVLECVTANWDPVVGLMETFQKESLLFKELALNIIPRHIAGELINTRAVRPRAYRDCTILFTDVVAFSKLAYYLEPVTLVRKLNAYFSAYDDTMDRFGIEKIKTIGDSYMCASGLPMKKESHAVDGALAALHIMRLMKEIRSEPRVVGGFDLNNWDIRIGMHSGPCISGVVGNKKYFFDIWGHSVNVAARMESASEPGRINISAATHEQIQAFFDSSFRGLQEVKNIGEVGMFFLDRLKPEFSADAEGWTPNEAFYAAYCAHFNITATSRNLHVYPDGVQAFLGLKGKALAPGDEG
ncbi:MAG: putative rane protein [Pseudomonadota bacterium]